MMLMIAKMIDQTFDRASPRVDSATMPSTIHMIPTRMPRKTASHAVVWLRFRNATTPAMMNRMPSAMWPMRDQPPRFFGEDAETRVDEAGGDRVEGDDRGDDHGGLAGPREDQDADDDGEDAADAERGADAVDCRLSADDSVDMRCPF